MKRIVFPLLVLAICLFLAIGLVAAEDFVVPGDLDGNKMVSLNELEAAKEDQKDGKISLDRLEEIRHIHENYPRTITDTAGKDVTVWKPVEQIVVFNSETVEVMRSLDAEDKIIGIGKHTKEDDIFFGDLSDLPLIGSVWTPDLEAVLDLHPDAVFVYRTFMNSSVDEIQETLTSADPNLIVIRSDCFVPESYTDEVEMLGEILEREAEGQLPATKVMGM